MRSGCREKRKLSEHRTGEEKGSLRLDEKKEAEKRELEVRRRRRSYACNQERESRKGYQ